MINNITKTTKLGAYTSQINPLASTHSLKQLGHETQILKTKIVSVEAIAEAEDVIFTTLDGEEVKITNILSASIGDKIRIAKNADGQYFAISIYQKSDSLKDAISSAESSEIVLVPQILKPGVRIFGEFVSSSSNSALFDDTLDSIAPSQLLHDKTHEFKVISVNNNLGDDFEPVKGVLGILNEILSGNEENDSYIACKVIMQDREKSILSTKFGNITIPQRFQNLVLGSDLILSVVKEDVLVPDNNIAELMANLNHMTSVLCKNKDMGLIDAPELAFLLSVLMRYRHRKGGENTTLKDQLVMEKLFSNKQMSDEETEMLFAAAEKANQYGVEVLGNQLKEQFLKANWFVIALPINQDGRKSKQKLYVQKNNKNIIRLVTDLDLENIGQVQLEVIISSEGKGIESRRLKNIDIKIRHKNKLEKEFFSLVKLALHNSLLPFGIQSTILFEESAEFLNNFIQVDDKEELSVEIVKKEDGNLTYYV